MDFSSTRQLGRPPSRSRLVILWQLSAGRVARDLRAAVDVQDSLDRM